MQPFIHPLSDVQSKNIGEGTRIWQFSVVMPDAQIGSDCVVGANTFIENNVIIGDQVTIKCGATICDGVRISDQVLIGNNVTFIEDSKTVCQEVPRIPPQTFVYTGASLGANATIFPGLTIGRHALIGAGSVVTGDVPAYAIVEGNPAKITGYTHKQVAAADSIAAEFPVDSIAGVSFVKLTAASDLRGDLIAVELTEQIPFPVDRVFYVMNVPSHHIRGEHAHKQCHQLLVCLQGSVTIAADNGTERKEWILNRPDLGIHLHPMVWGIQYRYSSNAVLAVFASHRYDPDDYIRDYEEYRKNF